MESFWQDLRQSLRMLPKNPGFTIVSVITLALGIGANATIFSVINALILNPPTFTDPDRVVAIWKTPIAQRVEGRVSYLNLQDWRTRNRSFEDIAAYKRNAVGLVTDGDVERIQGMRVTANFLPLLKVTPFRGRNFQVDEERKGSQPVAIISYDFWQSRFGGFEGVVGQQIALDDKSHTIIGILPPKFEFPFLNENSQIWTTIAGEGGNLEQRGANVLLAIGRLKAGVTIQQAEADIAAIATSLAQEYPGPNRNTTAYLVGAHEQVVGREVRRALWLLLGVVSFILLIACTNTANLLLVRASVRQKEIAIRSALGAGRWRIARHMVTESLVLAFFAGALGLLIANWGLDAIKYFGADQLPRLHEVRINSQVLAFTVAVSLLTGLLFSFIPALKASRSDVNEVLKSATKAATSGRTLRIWRDSLVVSEIALSLILVVGAGLMIKSFAQLVNVPPGFDSAGVLTGRVSLTRANFKSPEQSVAYINQTLETLKTLPGVESVAFVAPMPFSGGNVGSDFQIEGRPKPRPGEEPSANNRSVTEHYFQAMKISLIKGRYFNEQDKRGTDVGAAIVNQAFVQRYFENEEPLGKRISNIGANQNDGDPSQWEIVGVVGDVHHSSLAKPANPEIYLPYQQNSWNWGNFMVRTSVPPATLTESFRQQIKSIDRRVLLTDVQPLAEAISKSVSQPRFYTFLFGLFGALGLALTMTGVFGLISYTVSQRTQEIGIRMALGATGQSVVRLVLLHGIGLAMVGTAVGLMISFVLARVVAGLLFEVKPTDLTTFTAAAIVLLVAALLASYVPARRATKVDPLVALRCE
jgi:putative ABC transport system permease protein